jgi:predicted nucleotidyltransferase
MRDIQPILQELKARLQELYGERLKGLYLFGSYARGDAHADSDIDVALVLDDFEREIPEIDRAGDASAELGLKYNCSISIIPVRERQLRAAETSLLRNVQREGVPV